MSLLKYFKKSEKASALDPCNVCESMKNNLPNNITANELKKAQESLKVAREEKKKRTFYAEKDKQEIAKYAAICGVTGAIRKFQPKFPNLTKSTVRPWVKSHKKSIQEQKKKGETSVQSTIESVRGRPLLIEEVLNLKLRAMLVNLRTAGAGINIHVVSGVLNGLIHANPERFGEYMDFKVTRSWVQSLYQRMTFSRSAVTTSWPVITRSLWAEVRSQFLHEITDKVLQHNIADELIINVGQMSSKFVATDNITMAAKGERHILRAGTTDKRAITVTHCESLDGCMLPFQLIYTGKTERSLPDFTFRDGFCLAFSQKHWSNETKTIRLIEDLLVPSTEKVKEEKALPQSQKNLLVWDAFKTQATPKVMDTLSSYGIKSVMVPKNMTHLVQPLDLTKNVSFKKNEKRVFNEYFMSCIMEALTNDPDRDVTPIRVDLRLSTLKPRHAEVMTDMYQHLKSEKRKEIIKAGWRAAGITNILKDV